MSHSTAPFFQQLYNFSHCTVFIASFFTLTVFQTWKRKVALLLCNRNFLSIATKQVFCCVNYTFRVDCASHEDFKVVNFLIWQHNASLCETYPRSTSLSNMIKTKDDKGWMNTFYVSWANETERGFTVTHCMVNLPVLHIYKLSLHYSCYRFLCRDDWCASLWVFMHARSKLFFHALISLIFLSFVSVLCFIFFLKF